MPKVVGWDQAPEKRSGGDGGGQFLKLTAGGKYLVRLVSKPIEYLQHWTPIVCRSPGYNEKGEPIDPLIQMGQDPSKRYAIWVLNRNEGNKLQIMDFPPSLYEKFKDWKDAFNQEPGGTGGPDWRIALEIPAGANKKRTQYKATAGPAAPFTDEEIAMIKGGVKVGDKTMNLREALEYHRRDNTPEEIRDMLAKKQNQQMSDDGPPARSAPAASAPAAAPAKKPAPANDDILNF